MKLGLFSPWKGQSPLWLMPAFFSCTCRPTTSTMSTRPSSSWTKAGGITDASLGPRPRGLSRSARLRAYATELNSLHSAAGPEWQPVTCRSIHSAGDRPRAARPAPVHGVLKHLDRHQEGRSEGFEMRHSHRRRHRACLTMPTSMLIVSTVLATACGAATAQVGTPSPAAPAASAANSTADARAQREADKVFQWIRIHSDKPRK